MESDQTTHAGGTGGTGGVGGVKRPTALSGRANPSLAGHVLASGSSEMDESAAQERDASRLPIDPNDIHLSNMRRKRVPPPKEEPPTSPRHIIEAVLVVCIAVAVLVRMARAADPLVRNKTPQLAILVAVGTLCCITHWGTPCTIVSTPVRYIRRYEPVDPIYVAVLMPMLAASMLLGTASDGALAPPHIGANAAGDWNTEYLPIFKWHVPPTAAKAVHVDVQSLVSLTVLLHIIIATWQRVRVGPRFEGRRTVLELCTGFLSAGIAIAGISVVGKAAAKGMFLGDLSYTQIIVTSAMCQSTLLLWSRVGERNFTLAELSASCAFAVMMGVEAVNMTASALWPAIGLSVFREPTALLAYQLALITGMLLIGFLLSPLLVLSRTLAQRPMHRLRWPDKRDLHRRLLALSFFVFATLIVVGVLGTWVRILLGRRDPWFYVVRSLFQGSHWWSRWALLAYWAALCNVALLFVQLIVKRVWKYATLGDSVQRNTAIRWGTSRLDSLPPRNSQQSLRPTLPLSINSRRKFFHFCAVLMFVPGTALDPAFMHLAFSVGFSVFLLLEFLRYYAVYPVGAGLHFFLSQFLDSKDSGLLILSHVYLLSGCAVGLWFDSRSRIAQQLGTLVLGVGDALASIVGRRFGRHKWPGSNKSVEGSLAFVASIVCCAVLLQVVGWVETVPLARFTAIVSALSLLEGVSEQNDNLVLPVCGLVLCALL
ncbi:dolichol kinase [Malassezia cuniculi]|uniref:dolichol kinase n=1 Tax=Malassezia cuniculi TaxID=948313 RepID=A0AAF0JA33_9BASI|nr:dolichol kinase [Malassezia cuniculi]